MKKSRRRKSRYAAGAVVLMLCAASAVFWFCFHKKPVRISERENGIWLAHRWAENPADEKEIIGLSENLRDSRIRHVFLHSGPLDSLGKISSDKYASAGEFIFLLKKNNPEILSVQAWIGQIEKKGGGVLDINSDSTRENIIKTCTELMAVGFDGIHVDIEPILDGDTLFLLLLERIKNEAVGDAFLTCATPKISLGKLFGQTLKILFSVKGLWSEEYYRQVSEKCDFTVAMLYDTRIKDPGIYNLFISLEVMKLTKTVSNPVMIGIPSYEEVKPSFSPEIENLASALEAVFIGLKYGNRDKYKGFSIYADWTMEEEEWDLIKEHVKSEKHYE